MSNKITIVKNTRKKRKLRKSRPKVKIVVNSKRKRKNKRNKRKHKGGDSHFIEHAKLINNPCMGPLVRTISGGSITERFRRSITGSVTGTNNSGYLVWFPSYHNIGSGTGNSANMWYYENSNSATAAANTVANPFGATQAISGQSIQDPVNDVIGPAGAFDRARTLAACIQVEYTGALNLISGQVAVIQNLPYHAFFKVAAGAGPAFTTMSVDNLFSFASERRRFQLDGHEVAWRPTSDSTPMRTDGSDHIAGQVSPDTVVDGGTPASFASILSCADPSQCMGIAIAWKGLPSGVNGILNINVVKVADLELAPSGTQIEQTFTANLKDVEPPGYITRVSEWLDSTVPGWQVKAADVAGYAASSLATMYAPQYPMIANVAHHSVRSAIQDLD